MKICPYCEAEIANNAKKCKYCGEIVVEEKEVRQCPYCEAELSETAKKCKYCGEWVDEKSSNKEGNGSINSQNSENWFSGRINRIGFLQAFVIVYIITDILFSASVLEDSVGILTLSIAIPYVGLFPWRIKRFHDFGHSGLSCFIYVLLPLYWLFDLYLICAPGQKQGNKYGDVPADKPMYVKIIFIILFVVILYIGVKSSNGYL